MMPSIIPERLPVHPQEWAVKCLDMISGANHHHLHCLFQENNCIHNWNDSSGHSHYNFHIGTRMVSGGMSQSVLITGTNILPTCLQRSFIKLCHCHVS